jgi:hypothetical protein
MRAPLPLSESHDIKEVEKVLHKSSSQHLLLLLVFIFASCEYVLFTFSSSASCLAASRASKKI